VKFIPSLLSSVGVLACCTLLRAAEPVSLPHAAEDAAWRQIAQRFSGEPVAERNRDGTLRQIEVRGLKQDAPDKGTARVVLDPNSGRVMEVVSDRAAFTNDEFSLFTAFTELERLTLWHNSNFHDKAAPIENYDASGLVHVKPLSKLTRLTLAGGGFDDAGMKAAAALPQLAYIGMWHVRVSDAGMEHLRSHPSLEEIRLGPFWDERLTDKTLVHLSTCPKLARLSFGETWLTYEGGLKHFAARKDTLKVLDLSNALIEPADVEKVRSLLPGADVKWGGLAAAGAVLTESNWHQGKARKWMPAELLERALNAAKQNQN
jgi:hypothetical protein